MLSLHTIGPRQHNSIISVLGYSSQPSRHVHDIQPIMASMSSYLFLVIIPFVTPLANYMIDKYGMSISVKIGLIFTLFGSWLKVGVNEYL